MKFFQLSLLIIFFLNVDRISSLEMQSTAESSMTSTAQNFMDLFNVLLAPTKPTPAKTKAKAKKVKKAKKKVKKIKKKSKKDKKKTKKMKKKWDGTKLFKVGWLKISSKAFRNISKYPPIKIPNNRVHRILLNYHNFRINDRFHKGSKSIPNQKAFWFRLSGRILYYSNKKDEINVLDTLYVKNIKTVLSLSHYVKNANCFKIKDVRKTTYKLCAKTLPEKIGWVCKIKEMLGEPLEKVCGGKSGKKGKKSGKK